MSPSSAPNPLAEALKRDSQPLSLSSARSDHNALTREVPGKPNLSRQTTQMSNRKANSTLVVEKSGLHQRQHYWVRTFRRWSNQTRYTSHRCFPSSNLQTKRYTNLTKSNHNIIIVRWTLTCTKVTRIIMLPLSSQWDGKISTMAQHRTKDLHQLVPVVIGSFRLRTTW